MPFLLGNSLDNELIFSDLPMYAEGSAFSSFVYFTSITSASLSMTTLPPMILSTSASFSTITSFPTTGAYDKFDSVIRITS
ncbi:MAG: hypothetical protein QXG85_07140 [Thermoproteota archaeon]